MRLVPDPLGNFADTDLIVPEIFGSEIHSPFGEIRERRFADQRSKFGGKRRTRHTDFGSKLGDCPGLVGIPMHKVES